jgi:hypothetical protein
MTVVYYGWLLRARTYVRNENNELRGLGDYPALAERQISHARHLDCLGGKFCSEKAAGLSGQLPFSANAQIVKFVPVI